MILYFFMATLTFETLQFRQYPVFLKIIFLKYYFFTISNKELENIGQHKTTDNSISFEGVSEKKAHHAFHILIEKGFRELKGILTKKHLVVFCQCSIYTFVSYKNYF